jgi:NADPH:quinone reductase-like Zn-dependent oxidoreductase
MSPNESPHRSSSARPGTMKAARVHQWGSPEVITVESIDLPEPADEELLVRVHAAGVAPWDTLVRSGKIGLPLTLPLTLGSEVSGAVEKVGAKTTGFAVGDEVFGATNPRFIDGYAEYTVAAATMIAPKPRELSHIEAASVPVVAVTAWQMLFDHAKVQEGQTVEVHGGGGNVGAYAVQLARASRLYVIATIHGDDTDYVRSLGAHEIIDTKSEKFQAEGFLNFARRADSVIDTAGGKTQDQLLPLVRPGGIIVSALARPDTQRAAECRVRSDYLIVDVNFLQLTRLADMLRKKEIRTSVGSCRLPTLGVPTRCSPAARIAAGKSCSTSI